MWAQQMLSTSGTSAASRQHQQQQQPSRQMTTRSTSSSSVMTSQFPTASTASWVPTSNTPSTSAYQFTRSQAMASSSAVSKAATASSRPGSWTASFYHHPSVSAAASTSAAAAAAAARAASCSGCSHPGMSVQGPASKVPRFDASASTFSHQGPLAAQAMRSAQELDHRRRKGNPVPPQNGSRLPHLRSSQASDASKSSGSPSGPGNPGKDYFKPLFVDCSIEYELPNAPKIPKNSEPILMIHPGYKSSAEGRSDGPSGATKVPSVGQGVTPQSPQPLTPPLLSQDRKILIAKRALTANCMEKKLSPSMLENCSSVVNTKLSTSTQAAYNHPLSSSSCAVIPHAAATAEQMKQAASQAYHHQMYLRQQQQQQQQQQVHHQALLDFRRRMSAPPKRMEAVARPQPQGQHGAHHAPAVPQQGQNGGQPRCVSLNCQCFEAVTYRRRLLAHNQQQQRHAYSMNNNSLAAVKPMGPPVAPGARPQPQAGQKRGYAEAVMDQYLHFQKQQAALMHHHRVISSSPAYHQQMAAPPSYQAAPVPAFKQGRFSLYWRLGR